MIKLNCEIDKAGIKKPNMKAVQGITQEAMIMKGDDAVYKTSVFKKPENMAIISASHVERKATGIEIATDDIRKAKAEIESAFNDILILSDKTDDHLAKYITEIRQFRMAMTMECRSLITSMQDVRKFFLEDTFDDEMGRVERFVSLCKELRALKENGTLDAVSDTIIKLTVRAQP